MSGQGTGNRYFCAGLNRFGRACSSRVQVDGDRCGRCRGTADLPCYDTPPAELTAPPTSAAPGAAATADTDGWTVAAQLQARLAPLAAGNPQLERLAQVCVQLASNPRPAAGAWRRHQVVHVPQRQPAR